MPSIQSLKPLSFPDYELVDSGNFLKLERFGKHITIRPEPQAVWDASLNFTEWEKRAHTRFVPTSSATGEWKKLQTIPERWTIQYPLLKNEKNSIQFRLGLTAFKHLGVFPEQAVNWDYIAAQMEKLHAKKIAPKFLNLFAYTGGASLAAKMAGADVTHVDSIKQVVSWANENQQLSGLKDIRWVVEDALKFVKREVKRGNTYHGIILDPPAYGHGANGEKWKLEQNINEMMANVLQLLDTKNHFLILNAYSLGFSSLILQNLISTKNNQSKIEIGELFLEDSFQKCLPLGAFARVSNL